MLKLPVDLELRTFELPLDTLWTADFTVFRLTVPIRFESRISLFLVAAMGGSGLVAER